jgi:hypothetical protein
MTETLNLVLGLGFRFFGRKKKPALGGLLDCFEERRIDFGITFN